MNCIKNPVQSIDADSLQKHAKEGTAYVLTVLSEWCPACQEFKPVVEFLAEKYGSSFVSYVADPEDMPLEGFDPNAPSRVDSIPYTFFVLGGTIIAEIAGAMSFQDYENALRTLVRNTRSANRLVPRA